MARARSADTEAETTETTTEAAPAEQPAEPVEFKVDEETRKQFSSNSDWPLFQRNEFVRAKQLTEPANVDGISAEAGSYVVVPKDEEESTQVVEAEEFERDWAIVKGPHKQEF